MSKGPAPSTSPAAANVSMRSSERVLPEGQQIRVLGVESLGFKGLGVLGLRLIRRYIRACRGMEKKMETTV